MKFWKHIYDWGSVLCWVYLGFEIVVTLLKTDAVLACAAGLSVLSTTLGIILDNIKQRTEQKKVSE